MEQSTTCVHPMLGSSVMSDSRCACVCVCVCVNLGGFFVVQHLRTLVPNMRNKLHQMVPQNIKQFEWLVIVALMYLEDTSQFIVLSLKDRFSKGRRMLHQAEQPHMQWDKSTFVIMLPIECVHEGVAQHIFVPLPASV